MTGSKYGGGGGQPVRGPNGQIITTRVSHFSKDSQGSKYQYQVTMMMSIL